MPYSKITENIFQIGGGSLSGSGDAGVFLVACKDGSIVLIDSGVNSYEILIENVKEIGFSVDRIEVLILTHAHIDHTGSAAEFKKKLNLKIYAHDWEREAIEGVPGTEKIIAANWYGVTYYPVNVDVILKKQEEKHKIGGTEFLFIHTPGHTPGSIAILVEDEVKKVLFGQDIHGPFMDEFNSNINDWADSMKLLISKKADILCEGHYGVYQPGLEVEKYIRGQLRHNNKG